MHDPSSHPRSHVDAEVDVVSCSFLAWKPSVRIGGEDSAASRGNGEVR